MLGQALSGALSRCLDATVRTHRAGGWGPQENLDEAAPAEHGLFPTASKLTHFCAGENTIYHFVGGRAEHRALVRPALGNQTIERWPGGCVRSGSVDPEGRCAAGRYLAGRAADHGLRWHPRNLRIPRPVRLPSGGLSLRLRLCRVPRVRCPPPAALPGLPPAGLGHRAVSVVRTAVNGHGGRSGGGTKPGR